MARLSSLAIKTRRGGQNDDGKRQREKRERETERRGAGERCAVDLLPDKGGTRAAGIDGLLVRMGPLCEMFSKGLIYNKVAPGVCTQAELMQIDPTEID